MVGHVILLDNTPHKLLIIGQTKLNCEPGSGSSNYQGGTTAFLLIAITLAVFIVSLTINMIVLAVWLNKKRMTRDKNAKVSEFEIEGNPCYAATQMKQTDDAQAHVYEMVREKRDEQ